MADANAVLSRRATSKSDYRGWPSDRARIVARLRRHLVAASLISGDIVATVAAVSLNRVVMELAGIAASPVRESTLALLILTLFAVGLYSGAGPSPYERLRLRALAVTGFVAIILLVGLPAEQPAHLLIGALSNGFLLLLFGHYIETVVRALLIRRHLWGASTVLVGCDGVSLELARLLAKQPDLGLRQARRDLGTLSTAPAAAPRLDARARQPPRFFLKLSFSVWTNSPTDR